jgi:Planctomycete cytochrome C
MRFILPSIYFFSLGSFAAEKRVEFNRDIRPILAAKCYACHGPDEDKREADLRLDVRAEAVKEVIKPGKPEDSEFWHRISSTEPDDVMPPTSSPKQLTKAERALFRRWITEGAEYQNHWAAFKAQEPHRRLHRARTRQT